MENEEIKKTFNDELSQRERIQIIQFRTKKKASTAFHRLLKD